MYVISALLIALILIGAGVYFYQSNQEKQRKIQIGLEKHKEALQNYVELNPNNVDFLKISQGFEEAFTLYPDVFDSKRSEGISKIAWADSLSAVDRTKGTEILKSIVANSEYPNDIRSRAINYIINDYELDFIDHDFANQQIFQGNFFEHFLSESNRDIELGIRKLNELSNILYPNIIASYRIAKWYASQIYNNPLLPEIEKNKLLDKMNEYVATGNQMMQQYEEVIYPRNKGLAYELKARIIHLSGGDKEEAEKLFLMAKGAYKLPPQNMFQRVYLSRTGLYYIAFLARNYGTARADDIRAVLKTYYDYYSVFQEPRNRTVRQVSFLIAARDSTSPNYPFIDFNKSDIEMIKKIYPEFGAIIDNLSLLEYTKGHPLEEQIKQILTKTN